MAYTSNYNRVNWQNDPSKSTPLGASKLNVMDLKIYELDSALGELSPKVESDNTYVTQLKTGDAFVGFSVDSTTGKITMTRLSGAKVEYDTDLEKIPLQYEVDKTHEKLILTQSDGTKVELDLSDFISVFEFTDTDSIIFDTSEDNKVKASLSTSYLTDMNTAKTETLNASKEAKSYAVGGTNSRTGEDTDNAKYYKEQAKAIVGFDGTAKTIPFDNSSNGFTAGNVQDAIEEASTKGGGGGGSSSADKVTFSDTKSSLSATNVQDAIDNTVTKVNAKLDKPTTTGTAGQILALDSSGKPVWEDNEGQGALTYTKAEWNALATKPTDGTHVVITDDGIGTGGSGSTGTTVVANPTDTATEELTKLKVADKTYSIPSGGSTITVDSALSDTSENPLQNKVVKAELDKKQNTLTIDTALSTTSTNTVQNKVVAEAINGKSKCNNVTSFNLDGYRHSVSFTKDCKLATFTVASSTSVLGTLCVDYSILGSTIIIMYYDTTSSAMKIAKLTVDSDSESGTNRTIIYRDGTTGKSETLTLYISEIV